jgi:hypothetical protein
LCFYKKTEHINNVKALSRAQEAGGTIRTERVKVKPKLPKVEIGEHVRNFMDLSESKSPRNFERRKGFSLQQVTPRDVSNYFLFRFRRRKFSIVLLPTPQGVSGLW